MSRYLQCLPVIKQLPARQLPRHATICQVFNLVASVHQQIKRIRHNTSYRSCYRSLYMVKPIKAKTALMASPKSPTPLQRGYKRASNIVKIMRNIKLAQSLVPHSAQAQYCPLPPHNRHYVKCPSAFTLRFKNGC